MRAPTLVLLIACCATPLSAQTHQPKANSEPAPKQTESPKPAAKPASDAEQDENESQGPWRGLQYRLVGPFRGGRVVAVSGVVGQDDVYYFGAVAGGVWKTTAGGLNWKPLFDKTKDASPAIGAIGVSESDPNVIYVGTGEACVRGNIVGGNGVYKSIDAGKTWTFAGLGDTHAIGRLIVNPKNPDVAFVAALGHPFADNEERGIFRTRMEARRGRRSYIRTPRAEASIWLSIRAIPISCSRHYGRCGALRGVWTVAGPGAVCTGRTTAGLHGRK